MVRFVRRPRRSGPRLRSLVAEPREGAVFVWSPGGPLTRSELELVQAAGDPLALTGLLPGKPVAVGDRWKVEGDAARCLSAYDALAVNALEATLEGLDEASATIRLAGEVRGAVLGGEGTITCSGSLRFDRKAGRIDRLSVERSETRKPGPVEAGLEIKSTLTIERSPLPTPAELSDGVLAGVPLEPGPKGERLLLASPDGKYTLLHDRDWHTYWDDTRQTVLKRLDRGEVVAQCNLATGPRAGKGRHQDLVQLRDDLRRALGRRFGQFLGAGEVDGDPAGGFRYKLAAQGREGDLGVLWYYYLVASPEGDQLLVTFTLADSQAKAFGDQDLQLIGSLRWKTRPESPPQTMTGAGLRRGRLPKLSATRGTSHEAVPVNGGGSEGAVPPPVPGGLRGSAYWHRRGPPLALPGGCRGPSSRAVTPPRGEGRRMTRPLATASSSVMR